MKNLISKSLFHFLLLSTIIVCISLGNIYAQDPAKACAETVSSMNSISTGLPAARIAEYENCVKVLYANKGGYKPLLQICFKNLMAYYSGLDNQTKVNEFKAKLDDVSK
ncbi:MAG: hypothetical protein IPP29_15690 [Bacteroidetes bacterium]|nr:hypothetical protein [Bacteroidota bacterium]